MPIGGSKGVRSGLQPGGTKPSNERVVGERGGIDTPGAHAEPEDVRRETASAHKPGKDKKSPQRH